MLFKHTKQWRSLLFLVLFSVIGYANQNVTTSKVVTGENWRCYAEDATGQRYFASDDVISTALNQAGRICDRHSIRPNSCHTARSQCARANGPENWYCYARDGRSHQWRGTGKNQHAAKNDALFRCQKHTNANTRSCVVYNDDCHHYW